MHLVFVLDRRHRNSPPLAHSIYIDVGKVAGEVVSMVEGTALDGVIAVEDIPVKGARTVGFVAELGGEGKVQKASFFT